MLYKAFKPYQIISGRLQQVNEQHYSRNNTESHHICERIEVTTNWRGNLQRSCSKTIKKIENRCRNYQECRGEWVANEQHQQCQTTAEQVERGQEIGNMLQRIHAPKVAKAVLYIGGQMLE